MAITRASQRKALNWRRERIGCKRSTPTRDNAPPVKKPKTDNLSSSHHQKNQDEMIPDREVPKKELTADNSLSVSAEENWSKDVQDDTRGTRFSAEGADSFLPDSGPQSETNGTHFSAEGGDSNLRDLNNTTEGGGTESEETSEAESKVDRWACRVCKKAEVSIVVLPCCHLCLCWDCEPQSGSCPVCGDAKADVLYIRNA